MSNRLVLRGWTALLQRQIEIGAKGSTLTPQRLYAAANAAWEATTGGPAPGAAIPYILGHDHGTDGGGAPIPRGLIASLDVAEETDFAANTLVATTWASFQPGWDYILPAAVSPGIDTDNDSVAGGGAKCYLVAQVLCRAALAGGEIQLINNNRGSGSNISSAATVPTTLGWVEIADVPCVGGRINEFDVQWRQTTATSNTITMYALNLSEVRGVSQPESTGTTVYSSVSRP